MMVRSFDKRIESLFEFINPDIKKQLIQILYANIMDNVNAYELQENGEYLKSETIGEPLDIHTYFFDKDKQDILRDSLF
jgi:polyphosphate kinase